MLDWVMIDEGAVRVIGAAILWLGLGSIVDGHSVRSWGT